MALNIPGRLAANCRKTPERAAWLKRLPDTLRKLERRWSLTLGTPFDNEEVSCAWVAPVAFADGTSAVLKLGMPHMEGEHELQGLRFWNGNPTVRVLEADEELGAMLLERCEPGTVLRALPESEQDVVIAGLLQRLWRSPAEPHPFRPLSALMKHWSEETLADVERWPDTGLVVEGLRLFEELPRTASIEVLLATDLHAGKSIRKLDLPPFMGSLVAVLRHLKISNTRARAWLMGGRQLWRCGRAPRTKSLRLSGSSRSAFLLRRRRPLLKGETA